MIDRFTLQIAQTLLNAAAFDFSWLPAGKLVSNRIEAKSNFDSAGYKESPPADSILAWAFSLACKEKMRVRNCWAVVSADAYDLGGFLSVSTAHFKVIKLCVSTLSNCKPQFFFWRI